MFGSFRDYLQKALKRRQYRRPPLSQPPQVEAHQFLFIGGLHRSGTSILHRLLCEHPMTSGFQDSGVPEDEGQHLQSIFPAAFEYGGPGEFAFHLEAHLTETSTLINASNQSRLLCEWGAYYDLQQRVLLEKSPPNLVRSRFLRQMFPRSKFVFIVRHPLAVALATEKWSNKTMIERLLHWHTAHAIMCADIAAAEDCLLLRYEDFVQTPVAELDRICNLIGIPNFTPVEQVADHNEKYFSQWQALYDEDLDSLQAVLGDESEIMARFGYSLSAPYVSANTHIS